MIEETKTCSVCGKEKNSKEFNERYAKCKKCQNEQRKSYREKNKDKLKEQQHNSYEKFKEKRKITRKAYYENNKAEIYNKQTKYRKDNKDKLQSMYRRNAKKYRDNNRCVVRMKDMIYKAINREKLLTIKRIKVETMADTYIKELINDRYGIKSKQVSKEDVLHYRKVLKFKRELKETANGLNRAINQGTSYADQTSPGRQDQH